MCLRYIHTSICQWFAPFYLNPTCCSLVAKSSETPGTVACQAPLSTGFPRQEHWSVLSVISYARGSGQSMGRSHPRLLHWQADSLPLYLRLLLIWLNL